MVLNYERLNFGTYTGFPEDPTLAAGADEVVGATSIEEEVKVAKVVGGAVAETDVDAE